MSREARMKVAVLSIVALAVIVGASCAGQSPVHRFRAYDYETPGDLAPGDIVMLDIYVQVEGEDWVKMADDVSWTDVASDFFWPPMTEAALGLPAGGAQARFRGDLVAVVGGEVYEVSCVTAWASYTPAGFSCQSMDS